MFLRFSELHLLTQKDHLSEEIQHIFHLHLRIIKKEDENGTLSRIMSLTYKKADTSVDSTKLRQDHTSTTDIMLTKAVGDIFPAIDPNRSLFINLSYEKLISNANIINYDYIADSFSLSFNKSFKLN